MMHMEVLIIQKIKNNQGIGVIHDVSMVNLPSYKIGIVCLNLFVEINIYFNKINIFFIFLVWLFKLFLLKKYCSVHFKK